MTALPADVPCPRRDRWIRGCRFEPRYDLGPLVTKATPISRLAAGVPLWTTTQTKTYRGDVCVTCGRTVERGA